MSKKPTNPNRRKALNVTIPADMIREARKYKINASEAARKGMADEIRKAKEAEWLEQNKEAIKAYNKFARKHHAAIESFWLKNNGAV